MKGDKKGLIAIVVLLIIVAVITFIFVSIIGGISARGCVIYFFIFLGLFCLLGI